MKSKIVPVLLIGGAAAGAFFLIKGANTQNAADNLILDYKDITGVKIESWRVKFNVRFDATNPTNTNLNLEQLILDLKVASYGTIAKVRNMSTIAFNKNERKTISIPFETDNLLVQGLTVINAIYKIFSGNSSSITKGTLSGSVKANGFTSAYNQEITFKK
jgi:hypothetical protein